MATAEKTRPEPVRSDSEVSSTMDEPEDQGYQSRSRSQSRRRRRQNQRQRQSLQAQQQGGGGQQQQPQAQGQAQSGGTQAQSQAQAPMPPIQEQPENTMQPFEWIGPDSTSMDGPVTYARAQRGEIPMRQGNPEQRLKTAGGTPGGGKSLDDEEGLKLKLELNLDVEVELKAKIYGDLTLALLA